MEHVLLLCPKKISKSFLSMDSLRCWLRGRTTKIGHHWIQPLDFGNSCFFLFFKPEATREAGVRYHHISLYPAYQVPLDLKYLYYNPIAIIDNCVYACLPKPSSAKPVFIPQGVRRVTKLLSWLIHSGSNCGFILGERSESVNFERGRNTVCQLACTFISWLCRRTSNVSRSKGDWLGIMCDGAGDCVSVWEGRRRIKKRRAPLFSLLLSMSVYLCFRYFPFASALFIILRAVCAFHLETINVPLVMYVADLCRRSPFGETCCSFKNNAKTAANEKITTVGRVTLSSTG